MLDTGVPYFDLSLQHVSRPLLARMRRWGDGERFLRRIAAIRRAEPAATFRSSFILGYPGETEEDHDLLLEFLAEAQLDWAGFFTFSPRRAPTPWASPTRSRSSWPSSGCASAPSSRTGSPPVAGTPWWARPRRVLVDAPGTARSVHEAPEIDGVVHVPADLAVGSLVDVVVTGSARHRRGGPSRSAGRPAVPDPAGRDDGAPGLTGDRPATTPSAPPPWPPRPTPSPWPGWWPPRSSWCSSWCKGASWLTVVVGAAVAFSDGIDGWVARRQGATRSGAFLDPLADKVVVLSALFALAAEGHLPWLPVVAHRRCGRSA